MPDDFDTRLVVELISQQGSGNPAELVPHFRITRNTPRLYRNTLVFWRWRAPAGFDEAVRRYLAWDSILTEQEDLDLSPHQVKQAVTQKKAVDGAVTARLPEAYQWLLVPVQNTPQEGIQWQSYRLSGQDALAVRASKKLVNDELLVTKLASTRLRMEVERIPLWRGDHVEIKQLVEDFTRYSTAAIEESRVLLDALRNGFDLLTWEKDSFAYAESCDESTGRYRGIRMGESVSINNSFIGLLVRPELAQKQIEEETNPVIPIIDIPDDGTDPDKVGKKGIKPLKEKEPPKPKRYHGSVALNPERVGRDASNIMEEVISHLVGLVGSTVHVTLEIQADIPNGTPDHVVRIVTENSQTLKFTSQGFELE